jgi:hypothetical protein
MSDISSPEKPLKTAINTVKFTPEGPKHVTKIQGFTKATGEVIEANFQLGPKGEAPSLTGPRLEAVKRVSQGKKELGVSLIM